MASPPSRAVSISRSSRSSTRASIDRIASSSSTTRAVRSLPGMVRCCRSKNPTHPRMRENRRERVRRLSLLLFVLAPAALAHDFWIEPSTFRPNVGTMITASLRVGMDWSGDPVARDTAQIEKFIVRDSGGERAVAGFEGRDPAGVVRIEKPGGAIIGYRSKTAPLELPPEKFE